MRRRVLAMGENCRAAAFIVRPRLLLARATPSVIPAKAGIQGVRLRGFRFLLPQE